MAATYDFAVGSATTSADNLCRWDGSSAGHYEVWFLALNERASQCGFRFRYAISAPQDESQGAARRGEMWATFFDRLIPQRNFGLVQACAFDDLMIDRQQFDVRVGASHLAASALAGQATGKVESGGRQIFWDLRFTPNASTYHHLSPRLYALARPSSYVCAPNLDTRFSGVVVVDGREFALSGEPGCQAHLWGSKQVDEWLWVHANAFERHEETVFDGLAARPRRSGKLVPPLQTLLLRHRGEEHRFVRLRFAEQWHESLGTGYWSFSARNTHLYLEGTAQCRLKDMLQARYVDPDGEPLFCLNTEVANLKLRIFKRVRGIHWRHCETLHAHGAAHLEHASREPQNGIPLVGL